MSHSVMGDGRMAARVVLSGADDVADSNPEHRPAAPYQRLLHGNALWRSFPARWAALLRDLLRHAHWRRAV